MSPVYSTLEGSPNSRVKFPRRGYIRERSLFLFSDEDGTVDLGITFKAELVNRGGEGLFNSLANGTKEAVSNLAMTIKSLGLLFSGGEPR